MPSHFPIFLRLIAIAALWLSAMAKAESAGGEMLNLISAGIMGETPGAAAAGDPHGQTGLRWAAASVLERKTVSGATMSITIRNPTGDAWEDAPIVLRWDKQMQQAFGNRPVVMVSPQSACIQRDDLDGDGSVDEVVFPLTLEPHETATVAIAAGSASPPPARTDAGFYPKELIGAAWESDRIAYRLYWNDDTAIDVFAKRKPALSLRDYARPEVNYHVESQWGLDVLKVGKSLGAGGFGVWHEGRAWKPAQVQRSCRVLATGPYRARVEIRFAQWRVGSPADARELDLTATISIAAGQNWSEVELLLKAADQQPLPELVAGILKDPQTEKVAVLEMGILGRWGRQALGDHEAPRTANLGVGVVVPRDRIVAYGEDEVSSYVRFRAVNGRARYRHHASWEHEPGGARTTEQYGKMLNQVAKLHPEIARLEWTNTTGR